MVASRTLITFVSVARWENTRALPVPWAIAARPVKYPKLLNACCGVISTSASVVKICGSFLRGTQNRHCVLFWLARKCLLSCAIPHRAEYRTEQKDNRHVPLSNLS